MENVYISGNDASGYDLTYNTRIKVVPVDPETGMLPTKHYSDITSLSQDINRHGMLYQQYSKGKK
jgi:hypothetical protein